MGVKHIVQGHEPSAIRFADGVERNNGEMFQRFGLIFLIDTGMSEGIGDSDGAILRITNSGQDAIAMYPDGKQTSIWNARSNPDVGRAQVCGRSSASRIDRQYGLQNSVFVENGRTLRMSKVSIHLSYAPESLFS